MKGWSTRSQFTDMDLPCVSEGPGGMGTRKSGRGGARGREIRNALRPPAMESYTQRVDTWRCHLIAKVRQTLTTRFSVSYTRVPLPANAFSSSLPPRAAFPIIADGTIKTRRSAGGKIHRCYSRWNSEEWTWSTRRSANSRLRHHIRAARPEHGTHPVRAVLAIPARRR